MNLAEKISADNMKTIAIWKFGIEMVKVDNLCRGKSAEDFNCEVMVRWRNESANNTKEVIGNWYIFNHKHKNEEVKYYQVS